MFENVGARTHGRRLDWYTISSGSGELMKSHLLEADSWINLATCVKIPSFDAGDKNMQ